MFTKAQTFNPDFVAAISFTTCLIELQLIPLIYLYRHTKEEGQEVHDGEAWEKLSLQKHGGVVLVAVLHCGIVLM